MTSWLPIAPHSDFTLSNLPLCICTTSKNPSPLPATRLGNHLLLLSPLHDAGLLLPSTIPTPCFTSPTLNPLFSLPSSTLSALRHRLAFLLSADCPDLRENSLLCEVALVDIDADHAQVRYHLPVQIGDYSDFYAGRHHAFKVGRMFRGEGNELQPNYEELPVGYHGRASSVVVSGTGIRRPIGLLGKGVFGVSQKVDFEVELGAIVGGGETEMGVAVGVEEAQRRVVGFVLVNDWSARDIQAFEYVPLGPFTSKSFGTSISAFVVLSDALRPYTCPGLPRTSTSPLASYLHHPHNLTPSIFNLTLQTSIFNNEGSGGIISTTNSKNLLWSFEQMLAHQTITGCNVRTGDLLASGTVSGEGEGEEGCLLEATRNGEVEVKTKDGEWKGRWVSDGDKVVIRGWAGTGPERVGWGEEGVQGWVGPALASGLKQA